MGDSAAPRERDVLRMSGSGSVSRWIGDIKDGRDSAAGKLWERYSEKLLELARIKLAGTSCRMADEEDVVITAFQSFLRRTREGDYPQLRDRGELWRLLATITIHKALNLIRAEKSGKRGGGRVVNVPSRSDSPHSMIHETLVSLETSEPNPQVLVMFTDSLNYLLSRLGDDELREIALAKLRGDSHGEIAEKIDRSLPTVERRLRLIRDLWREELLD
jgi:DNA-directed RNA polymerase specialized sigma24 family protein